MLIILAAIIAMTTVSGVSTSIPIIEETDGHAIAWEGSVYDGLNGEPEEAFVELFNEDDTRIATIWPEYDGTFCIHEGYTTLDATDDMYIIVTLRDDTRTRTDIDFDDDYSWNGRCWVYDAGVFDFTMATFP